MTNGRLFSTACLWTSRPRSSRPYCKALPYLEKADKAPIQRQSNLSDLKLKEELKHRLKAAKEQNEDQDDFFSKLLPAFGEGSAK